MSTGSEETRAPDQSSIDDDATKEEVMELYRQLGIDTQEARDRLNRMKSLPAAAGLYRLVTRFGQNTDSLT